MGELLPRALPGGYVGILMVAPGGVRQRPHASGVGAYATVITNFVASLVSLEITPASIYIYYPRDDPPGYVRYASVYRRRGDRYGFTAGRVVFDPDYMGW